MINNGIKSILRNIFLFVILITVTFIIVFKNYNIKYTFKMIQNANTFYIILAILCMIFYFFAEGLNNRLILRSLGKKINLFQAIRFSMIGFFFSGITPASGGGQPLQIYYMSKENIKSSHATLTLLVQLISFHSITLLLAIIGAIYNHKLLSDGLVILLIYGLVIKGSILAIMIVCFSNRHASKKIIEFIIKIFKKFHVKNLEEKEESFRAIQEDYNNGAKYIRQHKNVFLRTIIIIIIQVICYYTIPYLIYKSFGLSANGWFTIFTLQAVLYCSVASVPLPGAVGVSEASFLSIYKIIFGESLLASAMIVNRAISFYLFIFLASLIVIFTTIKNLNRKNKFFVKKANS